MTVGLDDDAGSDYSHGCASETGRGKRNAGGYRRRWGGRRELKDSEVGAVAPELFDGTVLQRQAFELDSQKRLRNCNGQVDQTAQGAGALGQLVNDDADA